MSRAPEATVSLVLTAPVTAPSGGHWNPGERVGFPPDVAADLVARGAARVAPAPQPAAQAAAPDAPPAHKMVEAPARKKERK